MKEKCLQGEEGLEPGIKMVKEDWTQTVASQTLQPLLFKLRDQMKYSSKILISEEIVPKKY